MTHPDLDCRLPFRFRLWLGFANIADGFLVLTLGVRPGRRRNNSVKAALALAKWRQTHPRSPGA